MSRFSLAEAEALGWKIVHQDAGSVEDLGDGLSRVTPPSVVAEKSGTGDAEGVTLHESDVSVGKVLERIFQYEKTQETLSGAVEPPAPDPEEVDPSQALARAAEDARTALPAVPVVKAILNAPGQGESEVWIADPDFVPEDDFEEDDEPGDEPNPDDFETPEEYDAALQAWLDSEPDEIDGEKVDDIAAAELAADAEEASA